VFEKCFAHIPGLENTDYQWYPTETVQKWWIRIYLQESARLRGTISQCLHFQWLTQGLKPPSCASQMVKLPVGLNCYSIACCMSIQYMLIYMYCIPPVPCTGSDPNSVTEEAINALYRDSNKFALVGFSSHP